VNEAASRLVERILRYQVGFTALMTLVLPWAVPRLLLIDPWTVNTAMAHLFWAMGAGGATAAVLTWLRSRRHRFVLRALALGSGSVEAHEMTELGEEPARLTRTWLAPHVLTVSVFASPWRPEQFESTTGISVALLGSVMVAAASLPLHVLQRTAFLRAVELAPPEVMREVVLAAEQRRRTRDRIPRRMLNAVATPVAFVVLGSSLIANAHLRRADEYSREETARAVSRASLELGPGVVEGAGLDEALREARAVGFSATVLEAPEDYRVQRGPAGAMVLTTPLDVGAARMRFSGSTVPVLGGWAFLVAAVTIALAAYSGLKLGRTHGRDLASATSAIRLLGTEAVLGGRRLFLEPAKFHVVAELEAAIEQLAERFRIFAHAQERAIEAREGTTRMRGLFFASVSHDLKSPLNAILGFAELVRAEALTPGQAESLDVIRKRGRELLALIETILDAARVEAGQLSLITDIVPVSDLLGDAIRKARELSAEYEIEIVGEIGEDVGSVAVDRVRLGQALGTLVAYGIRHAQEPVVRVRAHRDPDGVRIYVEVPSRRIAFPDLEKTLTGAGPTDRQHRGLALGVSLARSVVGLHEGTVTAVGRSADAAAFCVLLPARGVRATA
jgi:signal transduction histidine kinase